MNSFVLFLVVAVVALVGASPFRPTKTAGQTPELFWFQNDNGVVLPALLHGIRPNHTIRAIEDDVDFHLYNSKSPSLSRLVIPGCASCFSSIVPGAPLVIFAHGFSSDHQGGFGNGLRANFERAPQEMNLLFINWGRLAGAPWYETAANNVRPVGTYVARLIQYIVDQGIVPLSSISFVGHSLGSHVANAVDQGMSHRLPVICALDPALPLFGEKTDIDRIDPTDADFVNVIHTASGTLLDGGLAFTEPRGHADFYPNGGKGQPGCGADAFGACSHSRAHEFFGETAYRTTSFQGCLCPSWQNFTNCDCNINTIQMMGFATNRNARGIYHLTTNAASPFGRG